MNLRRKRLRLMRDTQWRGYARTATGNPIPLSQVRSMANLSVLGNSAQSGTPSPDNPVEVVGSGERTGNLFDISQITSKNGGYVDNNKIYIKNYSFTSGISPQKFLEMTGLQIGDTFTCRAQYTQMQDYSSGARYVDFITKRSGLIGLTLFDYSSSSDKNNGFRVSTIPSDFNNDNYYGLYFYGGNISTPVESEIRATWNNFAIYKGAYDTETLPPYEPYGYKVAVQASGSNLYDNKEPKTLNIYTPQPLHGVGTAQDSVVIDFDHKKSELVQEVSCGKFNGEEDWYITSEATDISKYYISTDIVKPGNTYDRRTLSNIAMYNNELNKKNQVKAYGFTGGNGWIGFAVDTNIYPLIDDFKSFLKLMYTNNNPVTVYVDCKDTPIITDITDLQQWDTLPDLKGTWILTANGGTEPTLTAEYYSNERSTE